jgi:hypothetical protein
MTARILTLDIETSPALADVWKLWDNNVALNQLREVTHVIGVGYKWLGERQVHFTSDHAPGHAEMVREAWQVLDDCDVVVHFNGTTFDIPHLHREFLLAGLTPPSPFKQVDLLRVVKKNFRFLSNKLDHVSQQLGIGHKVHHSGHSLWVKCMAGDEAAWKKMETYCKGDVRLTEKLYERLLPWASTLPHQGLFVEDADEPICPRCGSTKLQKRGTKAVQFQTYQQFNCGNCGGWLRGTEILGRAGSTRAL